MPFSPHLLKENTHFTMRIAALSRAALRAGSLRLMATKATTDGITLGSGTYESVQNYYGKVFFENSSCHMICTLCS